MSPQKNGVRDEAREGRMLGQPSMSGVVTPVEGAEAPWSEVLEIKNFAILMAGCGMPRVCVQVLVDLVEKEGLTLQNAHRCIEEGVFRGEISNDWESGVRQRVSWLVENVHLTPDDQMWYRIREVTTFTYPKVPKKPVECSPYCWKKVVDGRVVRCQSEDEVTDEQRELFRLMAEYEVEEPQLEWDPIREAQVEFECPPKTLYGAQREICDNCLSFCSCHEGVDEVNSVVYMGRQNECYVRIPILTTTAKFMVDDYRKAGHYLESYYEDGRTKSYVLYRVKNQDNDVINFFKQVVAAEERMLRAEGLTIEPPRPTYNLSLLDKMQERLEWIRERRVVNKGLKPFFNYHTAPRSMPAGETQQQMDIDPIVHTILSTIFPWISKHQAYFQIASATSAAMLNAVVAYQTNEDLTRNLTLVSVALNLFNTIVAAIALYTKREPEPKVLDTLKNQIELLVTGNELIQFKEECSKTPPLHYDVEVSDFISSESLSSYANSISDNTIMQDITERMRNLRIQSTSVASTKDTPDSVPTLTSGDVTMPTQISTPSCSVITEHFDDVDLTMMLGDPTIKGSFAWYERHPNLLTDETKRINHRIYAFNNICACCKIAYERGIKVKIQSFGPRTLYECVGSPHFPHALPEDGAINEEKEVQMDLPGFGIVETLISVIMSAIFYAFSAFIPNFEKIQKSIVTGRRALDSLVKNHKDASSIKQWCAKTFFGILSPEDTVKEQVLTLVKELDAVMLVPFDAVLEKPEFPHEYRDLLEKCNAYLNKLPKQESISSVLTYTLHKAKERFRELEISLRDALPKPIPHVNMFYGPEGIGKTRASMQLSNVILKEKFPGQGIYNLSPDAKYAPPYTGQKVWCVQEFANARNIEEDILIKNFNSIVSNLQCNLEGASIEHKVMNVKPEIINADTNRTPTDIFEKIPISTEGSEGFVNRITFWESAPTWTPSEGRLPRNMRPFKEDFSHIKFRRHVRSEGKFIPTNTSIGAQTHEWLSLAQVKMYTYAMMERSYQQYVPLLREAKEHLKMRELAYEAKKAAKQPQLKVTGDNISSVCLYGMPGGGKSFMAHYLQERLTTTHPIKSYVFTDVAQLHIFKMPQVPIIVVLDDIFATGDRRLIEETLMAFYNRLPSNSLLIWCSNEIPVLDGVGVVMDYNPRIPIPILKRTYKPMFSEMGLHRRLGYHGNFRKPLKTGWLDSLFGDQNEVVVHNPLCFRVANQQFRQDSTQESMSMSATISYIVDKYIGSVLKHGEVPINVVSTPIHKPDNLMLELEFHNTQELITTTSSIFGMLKAAATGKIVMSTDVMELFRKSLDVKLLVYHSKVETLEEIKDYIRFFIEKIRSVIPDVTGYISVGGMGQVLFSSSAISLYLENNTGLQQSSRAFFFNIEDFLGTECPNEFAIYTTEQPKPLFRDLFGWVHDDNICVARYTFEHVYTSLWAPEKNFVKSLSIQAEFQHMFQRLRQFESVTKRLKEKFDAEMVIAQQTWAQRAMVLLERHLVKIGVGLGIFGIVGLLYLLFKGKKRAVPPPETLATYIIAKKLGKIPRELAYIENYTPEELRSSMPEARKIAQTLFIYEDGEQTYVADGSSKVVYVKGTFDTDDAAGWDEDMRNFKNVRKYVDEGNWDHPDLDWKKMRDHYRENQMVKVPINEHKGTPGARDLDLVTTNSVKIYSALGNCYGLGLVGNLLVTPAHPQRLEAVTDDRTPNVKYTNILRIATCKDRDLAFHLILDKSFPAFKDITHKIISRTMAPHIQAALSMKVFGKDKNYYYSGALSTLIGGKATPFNFGKYTDMADIGCVDLIGYMKAPQLNGDCGLPYVSEEMANFARPSVVGIHVGIYKDSPRAIYAALYQEDVKDALAFKTKYDANIVETPSTEEQNVVKPLMPTCIMDALPCEDMVGIKYSQHEDKVTKVMFRDIPLVKTLEELKILNALCYRVRHRECGTCRDNHILLESRSPYRNSERATLVEKIPVKPQENVSYYFQRGRLYCSKHLKPQIEEYWNAASCIMEDAKYDMQVYPAMVTVTAPCLVPVGKINPSRVRETEKSTYIPTHFHDELFERLPVEKIPIKRVEEFTDEEVALCAKDVLGRPNQIVHQTMLMAEELPIIHWEDERMIEDNLVPYFEGNFKSSLKFSTVDQVLNGVSVDAPPGTPLKGCYGPLNVNKSAGWMAEAILGVTLKKELITVNAQGKREFINNEKGHVFERAFYEGCEAVKRGEFSRKSYPTLFHTTKKEELLPVEKAWKGRVFEAEDCMGTLLTRFVLGKWCAQCTQNSPQVGSCRVGIDPVSGFNELSTYHREKPYHFAGDISRHDKRVGWEFFRLIANAMGTAHERHCPHCKKGNSCGWPNAVRNIMDRIGRSQRLILNVIYQCERGMPSGTVITAAANSLIVELFYYYAYCHLVQKVSFITFRRLVHISTLGDDHIVSINEDDKELFNLVTVRNFLEENIGVRLDSDRKDGIIIPYTRELYDLTFISREFKHLSGSGYTIGALKRESITAKLFWVKRTAEGPQHYLDLIVMSLLEAALHSKEYYHKILDAITYALDKKPIPGVDINIFYMSYEEIMHRYHLYCMGSKLLNERVIVQIYNMANRQQLNYLVQTHEIQLMGEHFETIEGGWLCQIKCRRTTTTTTHCGRGVGVSKNVAKENAAGDLLHHLRSNGQGMPQGLCEIQMQRTERPQGVVGGGGILQELPQGMDTPTIGESVSTMVINEQLLDDKNASTSARTGGYVNTQELPMYHQHNAITAYFSGTHELTRVDMTSKTTRGTLLFSYSVSELMDAIPKLSTLIKLHKYWIPDFVLKFRIIAPVGLTGEVMVATMPKEAATYVMAATNPMAEIKKLYDFNIVGIEGNSSRVYQLNKISNQGFASTTDDTFSMNEDVRVVCYLHTPISSTYAETDTAIASIILEMALGDAFNMSMPIATLDSAIVAASTLSSNTIRNIRPIGTSGLRFLLGKEGTRLVIGGTQYTTLTSIEYQATRSLEPNWLVQTGNNPAMGPYQVINYRIRTTAGDNYYAWPLFVSGDIPTTKYNFSSIPVTIGQNIENVVQSILTMFTTNETCEVYYLGTDTAQNMGNIYNIYYLLLYAELQKIEYSADDFLFMKFVVVRGTGTTYYTFPIMSGNLQIEEIVAKDGYKYKWFVHESSKTNNGMPVASDYTNVILPILNQGNNNWRTPGLVATTATGPSEADIKSYPQLYGTGQGHPNENLATISSTIERAAASSTTTKRYRAACLTEGSVQHTATTVGRGCIPTSAHWEMVATIEQHMDLNGWTSVIGIFSDGTNDICEFLYTKELGLQINANNGYVWTVPLYEIYILSLSSGETPQAVDTSTWTQYRVSTLTTNQARPMRMPQGETEVQMASIVGAAVGGIVSGIGSGISAAADRANQNEQNEKDRKLKKELQEMINSGKLTQDEANNKWKEHLQDKANAWDKEKQQIGNEFTSEQNALDRESAINRITAQGQQNRETHAANAKEDIKNHGILIAGQDSTSGYVSTTAGSAHTSAGKRQIQTTTPATTTDEAASTPTVLTAPTLKTKFTQTQRSNGSKKKTGKTQDTGTMMANNAISNFKKTKSVGVNGSSGSGLIGHRPLPSNVT